ncbi:MAG: hypothetical protein Q4C58_14940 [Eubacteriales bacterium]|nr:hypothetical protein [Eubacteriales bacterium]
MGKPKKIIRQTMQKTLKKLRLTVEKIIQIKRKNKVIIGICAFAVFIIPIIAPSFLDLMIEKIERFKPTVLFYEQELSQDVTYKVICSCYGVEDLPVIMHMPFTIKNQSHKSSENLTILFSYTDNVSPVSEEGLVTEAFGINPDDINRSVSKNASEKYEGSTITLPDINPNEAFDISDYVRVDNSDKTFTKMQVKISSKDMESCYYNLDFYFANIPDEELYDYIENQLEIDWDKEDVFILLPVLNKGNDREEEVYFLTHASMIRVKPKK